jgi:response regulator RpfG family c-di-GMP phosphodiesterase/tRNA A-37 threonylcarbamoyl transferase component Bud32
MLLPSRDISPVTIFYDPDAMNEPASQNDAQTLLRYLLETGILQPEEMTALLPETLENLEAMQDREDLIRLLAAMKLLNAYQAARIRAGTLRGLILGNYRVLDSIGSGGIGIVFEAEHVLMRRRVAVKVVPVEAAMQENLMTRFLREIRAVARLNHPNIVAAFDAGICPATYPEDVELYYFVMEHLTGRDLEQYVAPQPLSITTACTLIYQVASALDVAHLHLLVHRDIKPSNIFVTEEGHAKLLDFGLVRHVPTTGFTAPDTIVGTVDFMAPEQAIDASLVDIRTDIYSLGATLFFALTGQSPFPMQGSLLEIIQRRQTQAPMSLRGLRQEVPEDLEKVVHRMMATEPKDRFASPQAVMHALLPFLKGSAPTRSEHLFDEGAPMRLSNGQCAATATRTRVLIVDADTAVRHQMMRPLLSVGMECSEARDAESGLRSLRTDPCELVLLAVDLPDTSGRVILKALRENPPSPNLKIIMTTTSHTPEEMAPLLLTGADDYFCMPMGSGQIVARVRAAIKHKQTQDRSDRLSRQLLDLNQELERSLTAKTSDLVRGRNAMVLALARLVEYRSNETLSHLSRMQRYCTTLAQEAVALAKGNLAIDEEFIQSIECCAPLHDIGNVGLPDNILHKQGKLDPAEHRIMQTHTTLGAETLQKVVRFYGSALSFMGMAIDIARHHHEQFDGTGYPDGLKGEAIPLAARIVAIADAYDALRSRRAQRPGLAHPAALQIMLGSAQGKYDPVLLSAFTRCAPQFERIYREIPDSLLID